MFYEDKKIVLVAESEVIPGYKRVSLESVDEEGKPCTDVVDMPAWELESVVSEEAQDATYGRVMREVYVVNEIYDVFLKLNVKVSEIAPYVRRLMDSLTMNENKAKMRTFGVSTLDEIRVGMWQEEEEPKV